MSADPFQRWGTWGRLASWHLEGLEFGMEGQEVAVSSAAVSVTRFKNWYGSCNYTVVSYINSVKACLVFIMQTIYEIIETDWKQQFICWSNYPDPCQKEKKIQARGHCDVQKMVLILGSNMYNMSVVVLNYDNKLPPKYICHNTKERYYQLSWQIV